MAPVEQEARVSLTPFLYRIGRGAVRHRWTVIAVWAVVAAGLFVASRVAGTAFIDDFRIPGAEAQAATDRLAVRFPDRSGVTATVVFRAREGTLAEPERMSAVRSTLLSIALQPHVVGIDDPTREGGQAGVSTDRTIAFTTVYYEGTISELGRSAADRLAEAVRPARETGLQVETGGPLIEYTHLPEIRASEIVGVVAAVVVLFVAFGSVVAMGVPIVTALVGLSLSLAIVGLLSHLGDVPTLTPALATMLGLGVGIDYALFIVTRYREGLARSLSVEEAVGRAIATSGQAVLFAGSTVMVAIWGLWVSGVPFIGLIGTASSLAVAVAVVAALTLLPALLGVIGIRIDAIGPGWLKRRSRADHEGMWARWARTVAGHPWRSLVAGLAMIGVLMAPMFAMRLGFEVGIAGADSTQARAAALMEEAFGPGINGPLVLVLEISDRDDGAAVQQVAEAAAADPNVAAVMEPVVSEDGGTAIVTVVPRTARADRATADLVTRLRETELPPIEEATGSTVLVGGATAILIDLADRVAGRLWILIATVVGLSFVLLMLVFRSILVPVKAAILNGLSICAAYGAVVAAFQWGWGSEVLGVDRIGSIVSFIPMVMFAILFGLSMDYEVFLLSRIREEYLVDRDTVESVAVGIRSTARVITSAALVMIAVFLAFLLSESVTVKMVGFGLAVAVLIDATVVRIVLVPATMVLLGHANWWIPRWLDRILPRVHIEGEGALPAPILAEPIRTTEFSHDGKGKRRVRG
jgi:RND superfamily putative drug exporter